MKVDTISIEEEQKFIAQKAKEIEEEESGEGNLIKDGFWL